MSFAFIAALVRRSRHPPAIVSAEVKPLACVALSSVDRLAVEPIRRQYVGTVHMAATWSLRAPQNYGLLHLKSYKKCDLLHGMNLGVVRHLVLEG